MGFANFVTSPYIIVVVANDVTRALPIPLHRAAYAVVTDLKRAHHMDWNYLELMPEPREQRVRLVPSPLASRMRRMRDRIDHAQRRRGKRRAFLQALASGHG